MASRYPQADKVGAHRQELRAIGAFLEWLWHQGYVICQVSADESWDHGEYWPVNKSIQTLLAEHFEIDEQAYEIEKMAMLAELRERNEQTRRKIAEAKEGS